VSNLNKKDDKVARSANKDLKEIFNSSDDKELERMLAFSKHRYPVRPNLKKKSIITTHYLWFWLKVLAVWFLLSAFFGWILGGLVSSPNFISLFYLDYKEVVKNYNAFCLSMMVAFVLAPFVVLWFWRKGFEVTNVSVFFLQGVMPVITVVGLDFFWSFGSLGRSDGGNDIKTLFLMSLNWDWFGAVLLNISEMTALLFSITAIVNYLWGTSND